jgi:hypothetical protein
MIAVVAGSAISQYLPLAFASQAANASLEAARLKNKMTALQSSSVTVGQGCI